MSDHPQVVISGFGDEASNHKSAVEQFAAMSAIGLQYYSLRFIDVEGQVKSVMKLTKSEITKLRHLEDEYGMNVASIGSPIGKVKLVDVEDGTKNKFRPFDKYLDKDVGRACKLAHAFETKLIRGFSFYHPKGTDPWDHVPQTVDQLGRIAEACHRSDLTFGVEIEANLVGHTGQLMAELHRQVNHPALVTIYDGGNIISQGFSEAQAFEQYEAMKPSIGWIHFKDYQDPNPGRRADYVNEDKLTSFVPAPLGDSGYEAIIKDFAKDIPTLHDRLTKRGIPGVIFELEPHLKGGGQFGGFSGPDGMGVALRNLCSMLDRLKINYELRDFDDIRAARGF